jgi:hypothetical protein
MPLNQLRDVHQFIPLLALLLSRAQYASQLRDAGHVQAYGLGFAGEKILVKLEKHENSVGMMLLLHVLEERRHRATLFINWF